MEDLTPILGRLDRIEALLSGPKITPEYLDTQGAAEFIGLSKLTLEQWRSEGQGPTYCKVGRAIRYYIEDLRAFMNAGRQHALE